MLKTTHIFALSLLSLSIQHVFAQNTQPQVDVSDLPTIELQAQTTPKDHLDDAAGDQVIKKDQLIQGGTTIGNALNGQAGIYSAQYTGGVSRPVIRGQDGARVRITQNGGDALDVSSVSPDHAVTVDPNSADQIEILKGPETLLYGAGSVGGLVNVVDHKIPSKMPEQGYEGRVGARYNTGDDGLVYTADTTIGLGSQVALNVGGLQRDANNYILPHDLQNDSRREDSTFAQSHDYHAGLSWIYDRGYTGIAYSERHDKYGIPGDNPLYGLCSPEAGKLSCGTLQQQQAAMQDDDGASAWINLKEKRYDIKSELSDPFTGFNKLAAQATYTDYQHQEMDGDEPDTTFISKGTDARITLDNNSWLGWTGQLGSQYTQQKLNINGEEALMDPTKTQRYSLFGLQEKQLDQLHFQVSSRIDHQKIDIDGNDVDVGAKNYSGTAYSAAASTDWQFIPNYKLSLTASHQERLPMAQELYSNGAHMATNTYELGNDDLDIEKSNNIELGLHFDHDRLKYNLSAFQNWYDNFIYANTLDRFDDFRLIQYDQTNARFYGVDADLSYQISSRYNAGLFGDYVRGKLDDNGNAPRIPGGRIGTRIKADFGEGYSGTAEYYHVFHQDDIANYETEGKSYNMLNLGLGYQGQLNQKAGYQLYAKANNLLDSKVYLHESFLSDVPQIGRNFTVGVDFNF
ncbi:MULTISPECIES: zinc piracy TonB-dependent receptor ZnuD [unclassified Acinetobacter]|uniref:zinc piracy TonB-dependent receptor ZnuD n=1 Tax=unclassified Acinetobacter TaxID=196816 RepID=UPI00190E26D5|nr:MULTISPECIES: zinc piracy TonB-dependent receptor ZnuD [unclassified Acinetobacter]MBK0064531.1 TonB-dependent receptor [Acinetobacter sp. S55]MBK0067922.1 TonB-dependent receptor [Acinetobacter sp. S54]